MPDVPRALFESRRTSRHPVRMLHLGLSAFHRSHQAWYTQRANEAGDDWGIEAFTGRTPNAAELLESQGCLYTLIERGPEGDTGSLIESISVASDGGDVFRWRAGFTEPDVSVVTVTVTELGYHSPGGTLAASDPQIVADLAVLLSDVESAPVSAPARIVDGLRARWRGPRTPIAIVSCDNLPDNGRILGEAIVWFAAQLDQSFRAWIDEHVSFVSTMVDRITPASTEADQHIAAELTGLPDAAPVVTEPFSEWVLSGAFPAGRPRWEVAGARFVGDVRPYEQRKLWLLNAGHSLLAYRGLALGHHTIAQAFADPRCRQPLEQLWSEAREVLPLDAAEIDEALAALRSRFSNARIEHRLTQIAKDGSAKLPPRVAEVLRRRIAAGRTPGIAECGVISAWAVHLTGPDRSDPGSNDLAESVRNASVDDLATAVLAALAPDLGENPDIVDSVRAQISELHRVQLTENNRQGEH